MVSSERTRIHPRQDKPLKGATVRLRDRRSSREREGLEAEVDALRTELAEERARTLELSKGVCRIEGGSGAALVRALQKELAEKEEQLRSSDALLQTAIYERNELAARVPAKEAEEPVEPALPAVPTPSVSKPSPPAVPTPRTPSEPPHDSVYAYLLAELGTAEKRSRDLESDIQNLERTLQAKDALLGGATARLKQVEKTVVELKEALQSERDMADRKLRQALAKADREAETKRKRDVKEASEPVARLRTVLDEVYEERDSLLTRLRVATFQLEELKPRMAPLGVKPRSAKAHLRHRAVDVFNFGGVDNASRPRTAYFPKATAVLEGSSPALPALQELNTAAAVLDRYYGLCDVFNLSETDIDNLLRDKNGFRRSIEVKVSPAGSLVDLLRSLRKKQNQPHTALEAASCKLGEYRRKYRNALLNHQWTLNAHVQTLKSLRLCEDTVERLAQEKADLYARLSEAETAKAKMEEQVGGLEHAVEAASGATLATTAIKLTTRMHDLAKGHVEIVRQLRDENGSLRRALALESLHSMLK
ncbi:hypothetical protein JCM8115_004533 [Rhodotorula mucilaginosa]|uniref:Uncharacterized protein n=1 Tax=Rhodotorula mucilaginosa TaxID=5537 RepID=A0A9P7B706_RHOMI|nr:hypothetical protein C6P46_003723 [Rhodotorula mucilaginosa]